MFCICFYHLYLSRQESKETKIQFVRELGFSLTYWEEVAQIACCKPKVRWVL